ncbi:MAG: S1/P1 nuclease [Alistipes sp.]|nr:S1/P1 nuclease [Candidatus Alistipes equi]
MKKILLVLVLLVAVSPVAFAWGRIGHQAVAYIAECHLNPNTKAILLDFLDGESIVSTSNWPDEIRFTDEYIPGREHSKFGHSAFYTDDNKVIWDTKEPSAVIQITQIQDKYKDGKWRNYPREEVKRDIMYLTHAIGDMHCPLHVKRTSDTNPRITFYGNKTKYHTLWDNDLITRLNNWSFMEYEYMLGRLTDQQVDQITKGTVADWGEDIARYTKIVFDWVEPGCELNKVFAYKALPIANHCIQYAGYRMARYFNEIFK